MANFFTQLDEFCGLLTDLFTYFKAISNGLDDIFASLIAAPHYRIYFNGF